MTATLDLQDVRVVDCTLRDGGYYNAWDHPLDLANRYLAAMAAAGVDLVEIGFRSYPQPRFLGAFAFCTDDFLGTLHLPADLTLAVMVNASDLLKHPAAPASAIDELFAPAAESPVSVVRLAAHLNEAEGCQPYAGRLHELGYRVVCNLMQTSRYSAHEIASTSETLAGWATLEVLYFADSLGNMADNDVRRTYDAMRAGWPGPIGIHTHDNRGRALANTLTAHESGATWLDETVRGMGRGPGNTRTDFLLFELSQLGAAGYRPEALLGIDADFADLQQHFGWGTNLLYFMSAADEIHPTYVQMMQADDRYSIPDIVDALGGLRELEGHSFSADRLIQAVEGAADSSHGSWDATDWLYDRDVLLLATGPSLETHAAAVARYINRDMPAVLGLNAATTIPAELVTAYVACHPTRLLLDAHRLAALARPLIAPAASVHALLPSEELALELLDYGLAVEQGKFVAGPNGCVLPARLVIAYAMAAATAAGARRLLLAGIDGYPAGDARQDEMVEVLTAYQAMPGALPVVAVTPTTYPVTQTSVYAPRLMGRTVAVIPARYESSRFPGKPLVDILGTSLVLRVWERTLGALPSDDVYVATDDDRIANHCRAAGAQVVMTSPECLTGTDRVYEASQQIQADRFVNVQGDEPLIDPADIRAVMAACDDYPGAVINAMCPIDTDADFRSVNVPHVVATPEGCLLYMSRAAIPATKALEFVWGWRQVCIYGFPQSSLEAFAAVGAKTPLEALEDIEILRFLELGIPVQMVKLEASSIAVDVPDDVGRVEAALTAAQS